MEQIDEFCSVKIPVALTDIDHTLSYTDNQYELVINVELIKALKGNGINHIYLFTDMIFRSDDIQHRQAIIAAIEKERVVVLGCITPLDYFWDLEQDTLKNFAEKFGMLNINLRTKKNLDLLPGLLDEFVSIKERMYTGIPPVMCRAFQDATQTEKPLTPERLEWLYHHSVFCKIAIDIMSFQKKISSCKGIMFHQFLVHKPPSILSCDIFDDKVENLDAVNEVLSAIKLSSIVTSKELCAQLTSGEFPVATFDGNFFQNEETFSFKYRRATNQIIPVDKDLTTTHESSRVKSFFGRLKRFNSSRGTNTQTPVNSLHSSVEDGAKLRLRKSGSMRFLGSRRPSMRESGTMEPRDQSDGSLSAMPKSHSDETLDRDNLVPDQRTRSYSLSAADYRREPTVNFEQSSK